MPEKFTVEQKEQIVIESFTATNVAELCRKHGVSVAQFHRWKERFLEGGRKGLGESSRGNEYQKEVDGKCLIGRRNICPKLRGADKRSCICDNGQEGACQGHVKVPVLQSFHADEPKKQGKIAADI